MVNFFIMCLITVTNMGNKLKIDSRQWLETSYMSTATLLYPMHIKIMIFKAICANSINVFKERNGFFFSLSYIIYKHYAITCIQYISNVFESVE